MWFNKQFPNHPASPHITKASVGNQIPCGPVLGIQVLIASTQQKILTTGQILTPPQQNKTPTKPFRKPRDPPNPKNPATNNPTNFLRPFTTSELLSCIRNSSVHCPKTLNSFIKAIELCSWATQYNKTQHNSNQQTLSNPFSANPATPHQKC